MVLHPDCFLFSCPTVVHGVPGEVLRSRLEDREESHTVNRSLAIVRRSLRHQRQTRPHVGQLGDNVEQPGGGGAQRPWRSSDFTPLRAHGRRHIPLRANDTVEE